MKRSHLALTGGQEKGKKQILAVMMDMHGLYDGNGAEPPLHPFWGVLGVLEVFQEFWGTVMPLLEGFRYYLDGRYF